MCARNHKSTLCCYYVNAAAAADKLIHINIPVHLGSGTLINLELKRYFILLLLLLLYQYFYPRD